MCLFFSVVSQCASALLHHRPLLYQATADALAHMCAIAPPPTRTWSSHTTHNTTSRHPTPRPLTVRPSAGAGAGLRYTKALLMALTELEKGVSWPKRPKRLKPSSLPPIIDCNDVRGCYRGQPIAQSDTLRTVAHPITRG